MNNAVEHPAFLHNDENVRFQFQAFETISLNRIIIIILCINRGDF